MMDVTEYVAARKGDYLSWGESLENATLFAHRDFVVEHVETCQAHPEPSTSKALAHITRLLAESREMLATEVLQGTANGKWWCRMCQQPLTYDLETQRFVGVTSTCSNDPHGHRPINMKGTP